MSNFINAIFCIRKDISKKNFEELFNIFENLSCICDPTSISGYLYVNDESVLIEHIKSGDQPLGILEPKSIEEWMMSQGYVSVELTLYVAKKSYLVRLSKNSTINTPSSTITLSVEEEIFLPKNKIEYSPINTDEAFDIYKHLLAGLINVTNPFIGSVDYEADMLCDSLQDLRSIISWGIYLSHEILQNWSSDEHKKLLLLAKETQQIGNLGRIFFLHPLAANQAWTKNHEDFYAIIKKSLRL